MLNNGGNVSKVAALLKTTRNTIRRARDGSLEDKSRRPKNSPRKTVTSLENLVVEESKRTGFRYRRLARYLFNQYGVSISENTVKLILKRNNVRVKRKRSYNGKNRHLYDYEHLSPFHEFQLDTKHLLDKTALSEGAYKHMEKHGLPKYEWNLIDIGTRIRFTAYSYELSSTYGYMFIVYCVLWLRAHNVRNKIRIRMDNGSEFCGGSDKKLKMWNESLSNLDVELHTIPPGAKHLMGVVENSHRADDEFFLIPHIEKCLNPKTFLYKAQRWQDTWNFAKPNFGHAMNGMTPYQKLKNAKSLIHYHVLKLPTILMENLFKYAYIIFNSPMLKSTGQYVSTKCLLFFIPDIIKFVKKLNRP